MSHDARTYWTEQMDAAHGFMERVLDYPVAECGEPLACLREAAAETGVEVHFPEGKHLGLHERLFHVRESLVAPLLSVAEAFGGRGYVLHVEDAYRRPEAQARGAGSDYVFRSVLEKVRWELDGAAPDAELLFRRLAVWSATTPIFANHISGSAVDMAVLRRDDRSPVDLGAPYPELSHRTPMDSPFVSAEARRHRRLARELFAEAGFTPYPYEFWHYSSGDADCALITGSGAPARFGPVDFDPDSGRATPVADLHRPFVTVDDIRARLEGLGSA